jgi:hypothetical protein
MVISTQVAGNHLAVNKIEERCLEAGDKQGPITHGNPDIGGFRTLYADRKEDRTTAGSADAIIAGLCCQVSPHLIADRYLGTHLFGTLFPVTDAAP